MATIRIPKKRPANVPVWTYQGSEPSKFTFFAAIALAGLEGQPIRLDAATQRALLGSPVFGKRSILVNGDSNTVACSVVVAFGHDLETAVYSADMVQRAIEERKQLHPGR